MLGVADWVERIHNRCRRRSSADHAHARVQFEQLHHQTAEAGLTTVHHQGQAQAERI